MFWILFSEFYINDSTQQVEKLGAKLCDSSVCVVNIHWHSKTFKRFFDHTGFIQYTIFFDYSLDTFFNLVIGELVGIDIGGNLLSNLPMKNKISRRWWSMLALYSSALRDGISACLDCTSGSNISISFRNFAISVGLTDRKMGAEIGLKRETDALPFFR